LASSPKKIRLNRTPKPSLSLLLNILRASGVPLGYLGGTSLMDPIAFTSRRPRRPLLSVSVVASLAAALMSTVGCSTDVDPFTINYASGGTISGGGAATGIIDSNSGGGDQVNGSGANIGVDGAG